MSLNSSYYQILFNRWLYDHTSLSQAQLVYLHSVLDDPWTSNKRELLQLFGLMTVYEYNWTKTFRGMWITFAISEQIDEGN